MQVLKEKNKVTELYNKRKNEEKKKDNGILHLVYEFEMDFGPLISSEVTLQGKWNKNVEETSFL